MKRLFSLLLCGIFLLLPLGSCSQQNPSERKGFTMGTYNEKYSTDRAASTLTGMTLNGYIEKMVNGNIREWAVKALADNPNIIEQLQNNEMFSISNIIGDAFGQISGGILSVNISVHAWVKNATTASIYYGPILLACESEINNLSYQDFENMTASYATDNQHWMKFQVGNNTFYDFASVGKFSAHKTWFTVSNLPD